MPKTPTIPAYRVHKGSGHAVVVLGGRSVSLGKWNSPPSKAEIHQFCPPLLPRRQIEREEGLAQPRIAVEQHQDAARRNQKKETLSSCR